jgi:dipeptidyl aminopeptidase/acylaminoacyl peptidase
VRDNAADLNVDADRVGLLGRSAGGYLVLLAGMPDDVSLFDPSWPQGQSADVRTVVAVYGPADFTVDERTADPWQVLLVTWFMGTPQSEAPPLWAEASPTSYARADGPPVLIIHGAHDQIVPVSQARSLARAMEAAGQPYEFLELPYGSHVVGSEWWQLASQLYRPHILRFLDEHLR